jgi:hypothetical protein
MNTDEAMTTAIDELTTCVSILNDTLEKMNNSLMIIACGITGSNEIVVTFGGDDNGGML